jgi:hypothetical protein
MRIAHRKTSLTPQVIDRLALLLRGGIPLATACAALNVPRSTFYDWLNRDGPLNVQLRERIGQAQARGELALVLDVIRASRFRWQAAAWLLERTKPESFGRVTDREIAERQQPDPFAEFAPTTPVA